MDKRGPGSSPLALSALRLLCSPVRLVSAAIWRTVQQNAVSDYGMLGEFVSMVTDTVPELLTGEQKTQLLMGLRSQTGFPEEFCPRYDESLVTITWQFLSRLEKLFPLQTIQQVAAKLTDIPSALEECLKSVSHHGELQTLLGCRKDLLNENGGPLDGAHVTSALPHVHAYGSSTEGQHANPVAAAVSEEMQMMTVENVAKVGTRHQESMDALEKDCKVLLKKLDAVPSVPRWPVRPNRGLKMKRILFQEKNARRKMPSKQILARTQTLALEPSTPSIPSCTQNPFPSFTYTIAAAADDDEDDSINLLDDPSYTAPVGSSSEDESLSDCSNKHHSCTELASPRDGKMVCLEKQDIPKIKLLAANTTSMNKDLCLICNKHVQTDMKEHMKDHFPDGVLACPRCHTVLKTIASLRRHFKMVCIEQLQLEPGEPSVGQALFKCDECEKSYRYKLSLDEHKRTHNQLYCEVCRRVMRDAQTLARHKVSHMPFQCTLCEKNVVIFKQLSRHYKNAHKPSKPYKCHHCPKVFSKLSFFIRHEWKHTGQLPFQCSQCFKKFKQDADLVLHQRVHTNEKPYLCADCGKGFSSNSNRTRHRGLIHGKSRKVQWFSSSQRKKRQKKQSHGPCKYCGTVLHSSELCPQVLLPGNAANLPLTSEMTTMDGAHVEANDGDSVSLVQDPSCLAPIDSSSKDNTLRNDSNDHSYFAPIDQKDFSVASEEQDAPQRRHAATNKVNSSTQGYQCFICNKHVQTDMKEHMKDHFPDGVLACPRCGTLFKNMPSLRLHFKRVCFEQLQLEPGEARVGQGLLKCDECEKSYRYKLSLDKHKRTHNQLYCEVCRRVMRDAQTLARHKASHTPFQCTLCEKHFVVFKHLSRHYENAHKPSKPYKCHHCPKVFSKLRFFIQHEWKHTGQLPFQCSQCSKKFKQDTDLVLHQRVHTNAKPYLCADCGKGFSSNSNRTRHRGLIHGKSRKVQWFSSLQRKKRQKKHSHGPCKYCGTVLHSSELCPQVLLPGNASNLPLTSEMTTMDGAHVEANDGDSVGLLQDPSCLAPIDSSSKDNTLHNDSNDHSYFAPNDQKDFPVASEEQDAPQKRHAATNKVNSSTKGRQCFICNKPVQMDMKEHMKDHFPDGVLACPRCGTLFKNMQSLRLHFKRVCFEQLQLEPGEARVGQGLLKCDECEKSYRYKLSLDRHKRTHNQLYCEVCRKVMRDAQTLARHKASHTPFQCTLCEKHFVVFKHLSRHYENAHKPSKPYKCHHCPKVFSKLRFLIQHEWKHTDQLPFQCSQCSKKFKQDTDLVVHLRVHTHEKPFLCADCGKTFSASSNLRRHVNFRHGEFRDARRFPCPRCGKTFQEKGGLQKHEQRAHQNQKKMCHPCGYCGKMFSQSGMARHKLTHTGEKPLKCQMPDCEWRFRSASEVKIHVLRHHSAERPFECDTCGKGFIRASALNDHIKIHSGEKEHVCLVCGKAFVKLYGMNRHMQLMHKPK